MVRAGLGGRWAEPWSVLGLVHSSSGLSEAAPAPGSRARRDRPGRLCPATRTRVLSVHPVRHTGRTWRFQVGALSLAFQASLVASSCLSFPWEAVEGTLAISKLGILSGLVLIPCELGGHMTSPAWTVSCSIGCGRLVGWLLETLCLPSRGGWPGRLRGRSQMCRLQAVSSSVL